MITEYDITANHVRVFCLCTGFAVLTGLGAWLRIPILPVPVTLQVLFVLLSGLALGPHLGAASQLLYISAGLCGLPVFAAFPHVGPAVLFGPTGGYLLAFPAAAGITGWVGERLGERNVNGWWACTVACGFGLLVIYAVGAGWLAVWLQMHGKSALLAFSLGVKPFLLVDSLKALAASGIGVAIGPRFSRILR
ncbi:MAG: biotin transporter BioY [Actinobacteria bacterium]|nr:biotin transporter BioY [Actinomycetota bacterium]MBU4219448.1 biotin transporter BioY [Actinomycetota bacterium]MBU4358285.1 biotin transporter BioY [Actinomycetota bacterium]MBU4392288.1 biotin transporter BioY [Actinomycetota bacterium]MBU4403883.1 biotin transporter BioY [Actinomycetota bacterium]